MATARAKEVKKEDQNKKGPGGGQGELKPRSAEVSRGQSEVKRRSREGQDRAGKVKGHGLGQME